MEINKMENVDSLIEEIKKLHLDTVYADKDYNGYYLVVDEFFEKLKPLLEEKLVHNNIKKPKLEWEENPPSNLMTWNKANEYADSLGNGWRLPTIKELEEAYDSKIEGFQSFNYWSSIKYVQNTNYVWNVDFGNGFVDFNDETDDFFVRCVREVK